jgi:replication-associated recombination protein RarA
MARPLPPTQNGYDTNEVVSALQKAVRRSNPDAAIYWAVELTRSGYGAWCWKRLRTIASEDIGPAAPGLAADIRALYENWKQEQKSEDKDNKAGVLYLIHACMALCLAPKNRAVDWAAWAYDRMPRLEIPDEALDQHTMRGKRMGRGSEHFIEEASKLEQPIATPSLLQDYYRRLMQQPKVSKAAPTEKTALWEETD